MPNHATPEALSRAENFLRERIPLTKAMGLRVAADETHGFAIEAPVALNYNHLHTAFGGSINAVATLAAYAFLWLELREETVHMVVRESSIRFLQPVRENIHAVCLEPAPPALETFHEQLRAKSKARITLQVHVEEKGILAAQFEGSFVARKDRESPPG